MSGIIKEKNKERRNYYEDQSIKIERITGSQEHDIKETF